MNKELIAELVAALEEYIACVRLTTRPEMQNADVLTLHEVAQRFDAAREGAFAVLAKAKQGAQ